MSAAKSKNKLNQNYFFNKRKIIIFFSIVGLLAFGFYLLSFNKDFRNTVVFATSVNPENFTELYFEDNSHLPNTVWTNRKITFQFTVHNLENETYSYPYNVYITFNNQKTFLDKGSFILDQNQYKTITETYTFTESLTKAQIVVELPNNNQQIYFFVQETEKPISPVLHSITKQPTPKVYGAWYWLVDIKKALMWLGLDKSGQGIWGTILPGKSSQRKSSSTSTTNKTATPTPTVNPVSVTPIVTDTPTVTPTPTGTVESIVTPAPTPNL